MGVTISQKHTELTDHFCSCVHDLANQMDHAGQPFTPELQMLFALRGLTSHFHPLYIQILHYWYERPQAIYLVFIHD